jgi:hypothetical protein
MAVYPFHRIGGREGKTPGKHFVKCHAERVEIAARIDRAIHSPCLFRRHVGQRTGDDLGWIRRLPFSRKPRRYSEASELHLTTGDVHKNIGRLDILMDEAVLVHLTKGRGNTDCDAQETSHLHR